MNQKILDILKSDLFISSFNEDGTGVYTIEISKAKRTGLYDSLKQFFNLRGKIMDSELSPTEYLIFFHVLIDTNNNHVLCVVMEGMDIRYVTDKEFFEIFKSEYRDMQINEILESNMNIIDKYNYYGR